MIQYRTTSLDLIKTTSNKVQVLLGKWTYPDNISNTVPFIFAIFVQTSQDQCRQHYTKVARQNRNVLFDSEIRPCDRVEELVIPNSSRKFTYAFRYLQKGKYYIWLSPSGFQMLICSWIGKLYDCYILHTGIIRGSFCDSLISFEYIWQLTVRMKMCRLITEFQTIFHFWARLLIKILLTKTSGSHGAVHLGTEVDTGLVDCYNPQASIYVANVFRGVTAKLTLSLETSVIFC